MININEVLRKCRGFIRLLKYLALNFNGAIKIKKIKTTPYGPITVKACLPRYRAAAFDLYLSANNSARISFANYIIWSLFGSRLCFVAVDPDDKVEGIAFFYFNEKDIKDKTVHQSFIGVAERNRGKGTGTLLTKTAIHHFRSNSLGGISSRVSKNNIPSLKVKLKLGFKPVEEYFDPVMQEDRYYLVCNFESNRDQ
jgi:RimJ/RimL family protein N-acetyltransferase